MNRAPARGPCVPPVYVLVALLLMGAFHLYFPVWQFAFPYYRHTGIALIALAVALILWAAFLFHRAKTGMVPFTPATFLVIPAFIALIDKRFILAEEAMLEEAFGSAYLDYKARVRRWL